MTSEVDARSCIRCGGSLDVFLAPTGDPDGSYACVSDVGCARRVKVNQKVDAAYAAGVEAGKLAGRPNQEIGANYIYLNRGHQITATIEVSDSVHVDVTAVGVVVGIERIGGIIDFATLTSVIAKIGPWAHRAGREDAAQEALDHDAKLNGVRSRALMEYANRHHVLDARGWCSCNMYAPGDDDQCPERARLFAESLALARGKPV